MVYYLQYKIHDLMKRLVESDPQLAQELANANGRGIVQSIRAHQDNPEVSATILDCLHVLGNADPVALEYLKKVG